MRNHENLAAVWPEGGRNPSLDAVKTEISRTLRRRLYEQWRSWADSVSPIALLARLGK